MADVAEICGDEVARELHEKLPGVVLYVPLKMRDKGPVQRLDAQIAEVLISGFGGDTLYIPSPRRTSQETFRAIEAFLDQGLTSQDIALKLGVTQHYVFQIRRKAGAPRIANRPDPRQLPLFK